MRGDDGRKFHRLGFEPAYDVEVDAEFPPDGQWRCRVFGFDRDARVGGEFVSRWGAPLVVRVAPVNGAEWVGQFPAGGLGGVDGVYAGPGPAQLCAVVDGLAYLVRADAPEAGAVIAHDQVSQVVAVPDAGLLLLVRFIDIVAIGAGGVVWRSPRLAVDDLRVERADSEGIYCAASMLGDSPERVMVDPETGRVSAGPRLDGPPWN